MSTTTNLQFVLNFDGHDDCIDLSPESIPAGNELTVTFWAKGGSSLPKDTAVFEALSENNYRAFGIHLPWATGTVYFDCGSDISQTTENYDRIYKAAQTAEYRGEWTHWAFVKNAITGEMSIYRNGILWHSGSNNTKSIPKVKTVNMGKLSRYNSAYYHGILTDICIWNTAKSQAEIQAYIGKIILGNEPDLVACWLLNEGSGNTASDATVNGNHGTIIGATWVKSQRPITTPVLYFSGQEACIGLGIKPQFKIEQNITLEAWIYAEKNQQQWTGIVSNVYDTGTTESGYCLALDGKGGVYFGMTPSSTKRIIYLSSGSNSLAVNEWHHVAGVYDGQQMKVYIDGVEKGTQAVTSPSISYDPENNLHIGAYKDNDEAYYFPGKIAEIRLWNIARSQEDICKNIHHRLSGGEPGLVGYWPLNESFGNTASDRTLNANHGSITGATWLGSQLPVNRSSLAFNSKNCCVNFGRKALFKIEENITLEAWIYVEENHRGWPGIINNVWDTGTTESGYGLLLDGKGGIYLAITPSSTKRIIYLSSGANSLTLNEWHHIAGTYDGQQMKVYIDGVQKAAQAVSSLSISYAPENDLQIGMYKDNDEIYAFKGKITDVRLWNIARSQEKIQEDMSRYLGTNEPGLVGYWLLNERSGNITFDRTANGNHGAITGAVWV